MPKQLSAMEKDRWLGTAAWCNRDIGEEGERIAIKARFRVDFSLGCQAWHVLMF
jgi:hypothetical protein